MEDEEHATIRVFIAREVKREVKRQLEVLVPELVAKQIKLMRERSHDPGYVPTDSRGLPFPKER